MMKNKSRGQSLRIIGLRLFMSIFAYDQLYITLSRCTDYRNLSILFVMNAFPINVSAFPNDVSIRKVVR